MLAGLVGTVVAAGLLLRGAEGLWVQSALVLVLLVGGAAWACGRIATGWLPRPEPALLVWTCALAALSAGSARLNPVAAHARLAWIASVAGLAFFPLVSVIGAESRARLERLLRAAAWMLAALAVYQRLHGDARPPASLPNANVFAGAILLLLPVAARFRDGALVASLLLCLWWTRSVGAWMGLSAALILHRRAVGAAAFWLGVAAGFASLVGLILTTSGAGTADIGSVVAGPLSNPGPRTYADAPRAGLWLAGLLVLLKPAPAGRRFGPIAVLIQGLMDHAPAVPGVFWLFCVSAALAVPESSRALNIPSRRRPLLCALILAAAGAAGLSIWRGWSEGR